MLLRTLLENLDYSPALPKEFAKLNITSICSDSRQIEKGSVFIPVQGAKGHGERFIDDAVKRGVKVIIAERAAKSLPKNPQVLVLSVDQPQKFLHDLLRRFYDDPSGKLVAIGVTGTNGKTTITYLLESIFKVARKSPGVIGTVNHRYGRKTFPSLNTTPGLIDTHRFFSDMAKAGVDYCVMEVSSHALSQGRVDGIDFRYAIFTNLTSDHLDYHKNREDYFLAKSLLFTGLSPRATAIINVDDKYGLRLTKATKSKVQTYSIRQAADIQAKDIKMTLAGSQFTIALGKEKLNIKTPLIGLHNIYNILPAVAVARNEGISLATIKKGIEDLVVVPGRLERINAGQDFHVFVDYAHTEDALKNILTSIRQVSTKRIILVFGCGGDRDKTKRPKMGRVVSELADAAIITNDNPRSEEPETIAQEIIAGFPGKHYRMILDRAEAIHTALAEAKKDEIVVVAGKGHEGYQIFKDKTVPFKEHDVIWDYFKSSRAPARSRAVKVS